MTPRSQSPPAVDQPALHRRRHRRSFSASAPATGSSRSGTGSAQRLLATLGRTAVDRRHAGLAESARARLDAAGLAGHVRGAGRRRRPWRSDDGARRLSTAPAPARPARWTTARARPVTALACEPQTPRPGPTAPRPMGTSRTTSAVGAGGWGRPDRPGRPCFVSPHPHVASSARWVDRHARPERRDHLRPPAMRSGRSRPARAPGLRVGRRWGRTPRRSPRASRRSTTIIRRPMAERSAATSALAPTEADAGRSPPASSRWGVDPQRAARRQLPADDTPTQGAVLTTELTHAEAASDNGHPAAGGRALRLLRRSGGDLPRPAGACPVATRAMPSCSACRAATTKRQPAQSAANRPRLPAPEVYFPLGVGNHVDHQLQPDLPGELVVDVIADAEREVDLLGLEPGDLAPQDLDGRVVVARGMPSSWSSPS